MRYSADNIKTMRENAINSARKMQNKSLPQINDEKPRLKDCDTNSKANSKTCKNNNSFDILSKFSTIFSSDTDRLIILCVAALLIKEKANKNLLLALLYIFL